MLSPDERSIQAATLKKMERKLMTRRMQHPKRAAEKATAEAALLALKAQFK